MLMSTNNRFSNYTMEIIESEIVFYRQGLIKPDSDAIKHNLIKVQVHSPDSPQMKCTNKLYFCLWISAQDGHRKLYFTIYEDMQNAAMYILKA